VKNGSRIKILKETSGKISSKTQHRQLTGIKVFPLPHSRRNGETYYSSFRNMSPVREGTSLSFTIISDYL